MRRFQTTLFIFLSMLTPLQLAAAEQPFTPLMPPRNSEILLAQARLMMAEIVANMKSENRLPQDITAEQLRAKIDGNIELLKKLKLFEVSAEQEERFKKDDFEDARNLETLDKLITYLKNSKMDLPAQTVYAMRRFDAKDLKGAHLEMCVRVVRYTSDKVHEVLGPEVPTKRSKL